MMVGLTERVKSTFRQFPTKGKDVDEYLVDNFPDLIKRHKIARRPDMQETIDYIEEKESTIDELYHWKKETKKRVSSLDERVDRLETKYGVR